MSTDGPGLELTKWTQMMSIAIAYRNSPLYTAHAAIQSMVQRASIVLPSYPSLSTLVGTDWLTVCATRDPEDNVHPLLMLLAAAHLPPLDRVSAIPHIESVITRLLQPNGQRWVPPLASLRRRLRLSQFRAYPEWHSVLSELFLRDYLESRGVTASLTKQGPDIAASLGGEKVRLEVFTPARFTVREYVSNLITLGMDWTKSINVDWQFTGEFPHGGLDRAASARVLTFLQTMASRTPPTSDTGPVSNTVGLAVTITPLPIPYASSGSKARGVSPSALPDWITQSLGRSGGSWPHKLKQLAAYEPTILVVCPGNAVEDLDQLGVLGAIPRDPWTNWQWPTTLPPECKAIVLWWYQLGTSSPYRACLFYRKPRPALPQWLIDAIPGILVELP